MNDDRVKGVFACGVAPITPGPMGLIRGFNISRDLLLASKPQYTQREAARFEHICLREQANGHFIDTIMRADTAIRPALSKTLFKGKGLDQKNAVENPSKPMCIVQGVEDPFIRTDYLKKLNSHNLFTQQIIMMDGCGHAPFLEDSDKFNSYVSDFAKWVHGDVFTFDRAPSRSLNAA